MKNILITGAMGNVGLEVIKSLCQAQDQLNIIAGVRNPEDNPTIFLNYNISKIKFNFTVSETYDAAFRNCDVLFLIRPPQISDAKRIFKPLIESAKRNGIRHIVFLSVQGAEKSSIIPHNKIERYIVESGIPYTFLRPAYFMQNFTTTLRTDLVLNKRIFLPAGNSKFTLIDVRDIGNVAAMVIANPLKHVNVSYDLTCNEKLSFKEMAASLSTISGGNINYISPSLLQFYLEKRKEGTPRPFILVMIMLHYLPRFQEEPPITDSVQKITKKLPIDFDQFIYQNKTALFG